MFLIRTLFWLSLVIILLPTEAPSSNGQAASDTDTDVSAVRVIDAAWTTVTDVTSICQRNPQVCATGEAAFYTFLHKAVYGAELVYELIAGSSDAQPAPRPAPEPGTAGRAASLDPPAPPDAPAPVSQNTLQPGDLVPDWNGPTPDRPV